MKDKMKAYQDLVRQERDMLFKKNRLVLAMRSVQKQTEKLREELGISFSDHLIYKTSLFEGEDNE
jgi:cell shape-determining protein MreC